MPVDRRLARARVTAGPPAPRRCRRRPSSLAADAQHPSWMRGHAVAGGGGGLFVASFVLVWPASSESLAHPSLRLIRVSGSDGHRPGPTGRRAGRGIVLMDGRGGAGRRRLTGTRSRWRRRPRRTPRRERRGSGVDCAADGSMRPHRRLGGRRPGGWTRLVGRGGDRSRRRRLLRQTMHCRN